jgi:hypothetical protein
MASSAQLSRECSAVHGCVSLPLAAHVAVTVAVKDSKSVVGGYTLRVPAQQAQSLMINPESERSDQRERFYRESD